MLSRLCNGVFQLWLELSLQHYTHKSGMWWRCLSKLNCGPTESRPLIRLDCGERRDGKILYGVPSAALDSIEGRLIEDGEVGERVGAGSPTMKSNLQLGHHRLFNFTSSGQIPSSPQPAARALANITRGEPAIKELTKTSCGFSSALLGPDHAATEPPQYCYPAVADLTGHGARHTAASIKNHRNLFDLRNGTHRLAFVPQRPCSSFSVHEQAPNLST